MLLLLTVLISFQIAHGVLTPNITARNFNSACGDVYTNKELVLETIGYPGKYPPNQQCSYLLKGPYCPTVYTFQFLDFNLESSPGCIKDRLEIDNKDALCGNKNGIKTYYSETGALQLKFLSDDTISGRGYRILISRTACESETGVITSTERARPAVDPGRLESCCLQQFNGRRFLLTSPNFPNSLTRATDCVIRISKASPEICRIRFHVNFFHLGQEDCKTGYLQIDGKYLCGCNSDVNLLSSFNRGNSKELRFFSAGNTNGQAGFIIEVVQDECPKKYTPEESNQLHNDLGRRIAWPNDTQESLSRKLHLINEQTDVIEPKSKPLANIVKHVYFFAVADNQVPAFNARDKEETNYVDLGETNLLVITNRDQTRQCLNANRWNMNMLYARFGENLPKCQMASTTTDKNSNCVELNYARGYFRTPYYPHYYPGNMDLCYRFRKQPGYCTIRAIMQDFHLENSYECTKDYLQFTGNQYRYCGNSLYNKIITIDLTSKDYEEMRFVSDTQYCGKGFSGIYEQIACHDTTYPIYPVNPPTTTQNPDPPSCNRFIGEETFVLEVPFTSSNECSFNIRKYSPDTCKLVLYFERFDLPCTTDLMLIEEYRYCGFQAGRTVILDFRYDSNKVITYRRGEMGYRVKEAVFRIVGKQINNCDYPQVAPERLISRRIDEGNEVFFEMTSQDLDERICGVIQNTWNFNNTNVLCNKLMNITSVCMEIEANFLNITESAMSMLKLNSTELTDFTEIPYREVDCDEVNTIS